MKEWLVLATNAAVDVIDWLALIVIVLGAAEAFVHGVWTMFASPTDMFSLTHGFVSVDGSSPD